MKSSHSPKNPYSVSWKRLSTITAAFLFIFIGIVSFSEPVHAGLFSLISSVFESGQASAKVNEQNPSMNAQTMTLLAAAVNPDPNPEKPVDVVPLDDGETLVADMVPADAAGGSTVISTYTVKSGDTISGVAKMFNVSVNTVLWANNLTGRSVLQLGQSLVILPITGITYTVAKGDTVSSIAKKFKAGEQDILDYNDLSGTTLSLGQSIIIPNGEIAAIAVRTSGGTTRHVGYEPLLDNVSILPSYPGYFISPIAEGLYHKTQGLHGHNAIDFGAPRGTPIRASAAGTVIIDRMNGAWNGGYGNYIVISHENSTQTLYAHMSGSSVSVGEAVSQGQTIGTVGMTGLTTGPHVHFEIRGAKNPF